MGGFSPPVPTAPTVNSGVRTVTHIDTATSLIRDVSSEIQFEHAEAAPLLAMTKALEHNVQNTTKVALHRLGVPSRKDMADLGEGMRSA